MLLWTRTSRVITWTIFAIVVLVVFVAPIATVVIAGFAGSWTGPLPSNLGLNHFGDALSGENLASLSVSIQTAFIAGAIALVLGTWAALSSREAPAPIRRFTDAVFHLLRAAGPVRGLGAGLVYADEVLTGPDLSQLIRPQLRPAWSWDYYLCHPYFVHPVCVEAGLARAVGGCTSTGWSSPSPHTATAGRSWPVRQPWPRARPSWRPRASCWRRSGWNSAPISIWR